MIVEHGPGSLPAFERTLEASTRRATSVAERLASEFVGAVFEEVKAGGLYSPGTPVGTTGRTREAWERENGPDESVLRNRLPHVAILEEGSSAQAPEGFVRLAVIAAPLIAADVARQVLAERA